MAVGDLMTDIEKETDEAIKMWAKLVDEAVKGAMPGTHSTRGDKEFLMWFYMMLNAYGTDWATALEYVDGGKDDLKRATRIFAEMLGTEQEAVY